MKPAITGHEAVDHNDLLVHTWRVARLTGLGIPALLAEIHADHLDWHQITRLVQRGCPPAAGSSHPQLMILRRMWSCAKCCKMRSARWMPRWM
jgi:hypothetical protein